MSIVHNLRVSEILQKKMHFKNENDNNSNVHQHTSPTSTSSSTSSTDSGVIIIDNRATFGKNHKNITNNNKYNNNNNNNDNFKSSNVYCSVENDSTTDKIECTKKADSSKWNEKSSNKYIGNIGNDGSNGHDYNNKITNTDDCNTVVKNINIENVINISKSHDTNDEPMNSENDLKIKSENKSINCSPTLSIRSTSISIVSIDDNAIDSSIIDSDSEREADAEGVHTNYVVKKLGQQTTYAAGSPNVPDINKGLTVISQKISPNGLVPESLLNGGFNPPNIPTKINGSLPPSTPQIGSIALTNSTDVTFGDKNFFEGPVTIQQILVDRRDKYKTEKGYENGHDNPAFTNETGCDTSGTKSHSSPQFNDTSLCFIRRRKTIIITSIIIVLAILVGVVILTTQFSKSKLQYGDGDDSRMNIPINSTIESIMHDNDDEGDITGELQVMGRSDWQARPPKSELDKLDLPVRRVIISHTATDTCMEKAVCINRVRIIQDFHMDSQNWDDIGFNFLIGGDGYVYTGRGWNYQGAHTKGKDNIGGGLILRIVPRDGWLAQPPSHPLVPLELPVRSVIVIATRTDICTTQAACTFRVRFLQTFNIESLRNDDIIYNFLIGGDGNVYEGRGWDYQGAHIKGYSRGTISLAYIGTFKEHSPNEKQMNVTKLLLAEGVRLGKLSSDYKIYSAKKFDSTSIATASSTALYESFKNWPHWSD